MSSSARAQRPRSLSGTAAGAIAPSGRAIVAGGPEQVLNRSNPPGVRVTQPAGV